MLRLAIVPGLLLVAACAADTGAADTAGAGEAACFALDDVTGYHRLDYDTVYLQTGVGAYRVELTGACGDMAWTGAIERSRGVGRVCPGQNIRGAGPYNIGRCTVTRAFTEDYVPAPVTPMPKD